QVHAATWLGRGAGAFPGGDDLTLGADLDGELAVGALEFFVQAGLQPRGAVAGGIDPAEDLPGGVAVGVDALEGFLGGDPGNVQGRDLSPDLRGHVLGEDAVAVLAHQGGAEVVGVPVQDGGQLLCRCRGAVAGDVAVVGVDPVLRDEPLVHHDAVG